MKPFLALAVLALSATPFSANAIVYCKSLGVPKGCVARPVPVAPVVRAPGVAAPVVAAPAGVVSAPRPGNVNGGVNRLGRRR
jgi:hypothetical protein